MCDRIWVTENGLVHYRKPDMPAKEYTLVDNEMQFVRWPMPQIICFYLHINEVETPLSLRRDFAGRWSVCDRLNNFANYPLQATDEHTAMIEARKLIREKGLLNDRQKIQALSSGRVTA